MAQLYRLTQTADAGTGKKRDYFSAGGIRAGCRPFAEESLLFQLSLFRKISRFCFSRSLLACNLRL